MPTPALAPRLPRRDQRAGLGQGRLDEIREERLGEVSSRGLGQASGATLRSANERGPGGPTLDTLLTRLWEGLVADREVTCPWCAGSMGPRHGAGARPVAGRCADCGSVLS